MERITEDYCSQEVFQLLREKGFPVGVGSWSKGFVWDGEGYAPGLVKHENSITHQMAKKWLREKGVYLNIRIALNCMEDDVINNIHWVVDILDFNSGEWKDNDIWTDTYEEAVEAALKYSLKNLIYESS